MNIQMSKAKTVFFFIALMSTNLMLMSDAVPIVIANNLYSDFPNNGGTVNFILTGTAIIVVILSALMGKILDKIGHKTLMILSAGLFVVAGFGSSFVTSVMMIAVLRVAFAVSYAIMNVTALAYIAVVFVDERRCANAMGVYNAVLSIMNAGISLVAGMLAVTGWQNAYKVYWPAIIVLFLVIFCIPNAKVEKETEIKSTEQTSAAKEPYGMDFWMFMVGFFLYFLPCIIVIYFVSIYVAEHNLGDETFAGLLGTVCTLSGFFSNLVFGSVFNKFKRNLSIGLIAITVLGVGVLILSPSIAIAILGNILVGIGFALMYTFAFTISPSLVPESRINGAMGMVTAVYGLASFVGSYFVTWMMGLLNTNGGITGVYPVGIFILAISLALELIGIKRYKTIKKEDENV